MWFAKKKKIEGKAPQGFSSAQLREYRDAGGFSLGAIVSGSQASIIVAWDKQHDLHSLRLWEKTVTAQVDDISAVATVVDDGKIFGCVTFKSKEKLNAKKAGEFLSHIAVVMPDIYGPDDVMSRPLSGNEVQERYKEIWGVASASLNAWPRITIGISEEEHYLTLGDKTAITYEVPVVDDDMDEVLFDLVSRDEFAPYVRLCRVFRPGKTPDDSGRYSMFVVVHATRQPQRVEQLAAVMMDELGPWARLRVRRMWNRQHCGFSSAAGLGVWGWQNLTVLPAKKR